METLFGRSKVWYLLYFRCVLLTVCFSVFKKTSPLGPNLSDTMDDQSAADSQKDDEESVINLPSTATPQQQQHTDPASPTVATTPEPPPVACGNTAMARTSAMDLEYEVNFLS